MAMLENTNVTLAFLLFRTISSEHTGKTEETDFIFLASFEKNAVFFCKNQDNATFSYVLAAEKLDLSSD